MSDILLTAYPGSILGPIAKLLGILMDWIYSGISNITGGRVESVVLSIVIYDYNLHVSVATDY